MAAGVEVLYLPAQSNCLCPSLLQVSLEALAADNKKGHRGFGVQTKDSEDTNYEETLYTSQRKMLPPVYNLICLY